MTESFKANQAAKIILAEMMKFDIPFNKAWDGYNSEWYDNALTKSDKEQTRNFISDALDRWH